MVKFEDILFPKVKIEYLHNYDLQTFNQIQYAHDGDCCFDLRACFTDTDMLEIKPMEKVLFGSGIKIELPNSFFEVQIRPRSGFSTKKEAIILNSPGTIDSQYRGEIKIGFKNIGAKPIHIFYGDRIAQAKIAVVPRPKFLIGTVNPNTTRGQNGFNSTGLK